MTPCILLWELPDRSIYGDEQGQLLVVRRAHARQLPISTRLRRLRCAEGGFEFHLSRPGQAAVCVAMQNALVDGYLVRCGWSSELATWIIAGEPKLLPASSN